MERIDPSVEGEAFNPNLHEATFQAPQPDKKDGTVFYTQQKGFLYNGRVLRVRLPIFPEQFDLQLLMLSTGGKSWRCEELITND